MKSQLSDKRKPQPSPLSFSRVTMQRAATWFSNKPSFFRFRSKSGLSSSDSSFNSHSSSSDDSLSRQSTMTSSKASVQPSTAALKNVPSSIARTSTIHSSTSRPIHSTAQWQTMEDYRRPITNFFATMPIVPGSPFG